MYSSTHQSLEQPELCRDLVSNSENKKSRKGLTNKPQQQQKPNIQTKNLKHQKGPITVKYIKAKIHVNIEKGSSLHKVKITASR